MQVTQILHSLEVSALLFTFHFKVFTRPNPALGSCPVFFWFSAELLGKASGLDFSSTTHNTGQMTMVQTQSLSLLWQSIWGMTSPTGTFRNRSLWDSSRIPHVLCAEQGGSFLGRKTPGMSWDAPKVIQRRLEQGTHWSVRHPWSKSLCGSFPFVVHVSVSGS